MDKTEDKPGRTRGPRPELEKIARLLRGARAASPRRQSQVRLGQVLGHTGTWASRVEDGRIRPRVADARAWAIECACDAAATAEIVAEARRLWGAE